MAHHPDAGHGSADDEYLPVPGSTYEHTDAHSRVIAKFLIWLFASALVVHLALAGVYKFMYDRGVANEAAERRYPMSAEQAYRLPPAPRLQQFPENERYDFQREESRLLNSYGWENKEFGTVRVPISDAMRLTLERGLPSRPASDGAALQVPGMMPSDSSAGRVLERRRQ